MAKNYTVGCKLPNGIILEHPSDENKTVELSGLNKILIIGAEYATTEVDSEFWDAWIAAHQDYPALKSGAIFVAKTTAEVAAVAKENQGRITGLEPMKQNAGGVKPAEKG